MNALLAGAALIIVGVIIIVNVYRTRDRLARYEFHNRTDGGVVQFPSYEASKRHAKAKENAYSGGEKFGGFLAGLGVVAVIGGYHSIFAVDTETSRTNTFEIVAYAPPSPLTPIRDGARYRAEPNTTSDIVGLTREGETLEITGRAAGEGGHWLRVERQGGQAFIKQSLTRPVSEGTPSPMAGTPLDIAEIAASKNAPPPH